MSISVCRAALSLLLASPLAAQQVPRTPRESAVHVLDRLAWGATSGQVDQVAKEGVFRWIDRQLGVADIDDPALIGAPSGATRVRTPG